MQPSGLPYEVSPSEIAERAAREIYDFGLTHRRRPQSLLNLLNAVARNGQPLNGVYCVLAPGLDSIVAGNDFLLIDVSGEVLDAYRCLIEMPGVEIVIKLSRLGHPFDVETVWQHGGDMRWISPFRGVLCGAGCENQPHWVKAGINVHG